MIFYLFLDISSSVLYWIIKNLGLGIYYSISYLFSSGELTEEEKEKKKMIELMIEQKDDIEKIKKVILELNNK